MDDMIILAILAMAFLWICMWLLHNYYWDREIQKAKKHVVHRFRQWDRDILLDVDDAVLKEIENGRDPTQLLMSEAFCSDLVESMDPFLVGRRDLEALKKCTGGIFRSYGRNLEMKIVKDIPEFKVI